MGILFIFLILIVLGIVLAKIGSNFNDNLIAIIIWTKALSFLCGIIFFIMLIIAILNNICWQYDIIKYNQIKDLYISSINISNLTSEERIKIVDSCLEWNTIIDSAKCFDNSFWIGIFYNSKVAELEKFDISKIQSVRFNIQINKEQQQ